MEINFNVRLKFGQVTDLSNREKEVLRNRLTSILESNAEQIGDLVYGKYDNPFIKVSQDDAMTVVKKALDTVANRFNQHNKESGFVFCVEHDLVEEAGAITNALLKLNPID